MTDTNTTTRGPRSGRRIALPLGILTLLLLSIPDAASQRPRLNLLKNSGFEEVSDGKADNWRITDAFSSISSDRSHSGQRSLKVADSDPQKGSSVFGTTYTVIPKRDYFVRGWAYLEKGKPNALGVYLQFLDKEGKTIYDEDGQQQVCRLNLIEGRWIQFFQPMSVPKNADSLRLWIHSFNAATCVVYLDDLELLECFEGIFGDTVHWQGGSPDHIQTNKEDYSVRWSHGQAPSLTRDFQSTPLDWSDYTGVSFWLHAEEASGQSFMFIIVSENPITLGMDYWSRKITVDWKGWKQFAFAFRELGKARHPLGLDKINKVYFAANGWGNTADPDLVIHLEGMRGANVSQ